jgi:hypothetical protein
LRIKEHIAERLIPGAFAVGLASAFFCCSYWGGIYSQQNPFPGFVRFYQALGPPGNFFPTINQLIALCRSRASSTSDVLVVIGGNSTFLGIAQPVDEIWSGYLQKDLGPSFAVVNLAQRGAPPTGGAESVAEALWKQGYKVIYVANVLPPAWGEPDGNSTYDYLYWNAHARNLLFSWDVRDRYLGADLVDREQRKERMIRARMDRFSNTEDLWNTLCYAQFCTAWDSVTGNEFWKPRKEFKDVAPLSLPIPERFAGDRVRIVEAVRTFVKQPGGTMMDTKMWPNVELQIAAGFVPQMRARSLIVVSSVSPYYIHQLSADEQNRYASFLRRSVGAYQQVGLHAMESGSLYEEGDYEDAVHMLPSGGRRLANEVAPEVRSIAHELYAK